MLHKSRNKLITRRINTFKLGLKRIKKFKRIKLGSNQKLFERKGFFYFSCAVSLY